MKIIKLVEAHYFANPALWGYRDNYPWSILEIWDKVLRYEKYDNCKKISMTDNIGVYLEMYRITALSALDDWYSVTKPEFIK